MVIWQQTSLFAYRGDQTLENIIPSLKLFGEPTSYHLVKKSLEKFTKPGDVILDPCCGNGTTGIAALELNRKSILCDINPFAIMIAKTLFNFFDYNRVMFYLKELTDSFHQKSLSCGDIDKWDKFVNSPIPQLSPFKKISSSKVKNIADIYHQEDLKVLKNIFLKISTVKDLASRELLEVVFYSTLMESSRLAISRNRRSFYLPKNKKRKHPEKIFREKLNLYLESKSLIRDQLARNFAWTPKVQLASAFELKDVETSGIDYVILHLPGIRGYSEGEMSYLIELLLNQFTDRQAEITVELDYRGRFSLAEELSRLFLEMERVLKEDAHFTLIFTGHHVLLTLIIRLAGKEGWQLIQNEVEILPDKKGGAYPIICLTLQKRTQQTIIGALNKMKLETLYDIEESIIRRIEQYLLENGTATTGEILRYLIENYLHECLIEKPLEGLLAENFMYSGKLWVLPTPEQKTMLYQKRRGVMKKAFPEFIREMTFRFLSEEVKGASYEKLVDRFLKIKPRMIFYTPYYRLLMEECERSEIKLNKLIQNYLNCQKNSQFETLPDVLRRLVRTDPSFVEIIPGEIVGLADWSDDDFFKIYFDLFEKSRRKKDYAQCKRFSKKGLELLDDVTYLDDGKKEKIREYLMRGELKV